VVRGAARLKRGAEFQRVYRHGRIHGHPLLVLHVLARDAPTGPARVGLAVGRRLGSAVIRNRVRRRLREALREVLRQEGTGLADGIDLVLVARSQAREAGFDGLKAAVRALVRRAGVVAGREGSRGRREEESP